MKFSKYVGEKYIKRFIVSYYKIETRNGRFIVLINFKRYFCNFLFDCR